MAWLRIDDRVRTHPKIVQAGPAAAWFWFCGISYCREHLTDGFIPKGMLTTLAPGVTGIKKIAATLVSVGLWHEAPNGYTVHDFLDWNPSKADVEVARDWDRRRKELYSDPELVSAIRARDRDMCRYCGVSVNWKDRRGPSGGQFDHINPRGENSLENVVVACRRCNVRKGGRSPQHASMELASIQVGPSSNLEPISEVGPSSNLEPISEVEPVPRSRAGAIARGLGSGLGSGDGSSLEESARETFPVGGGNLRSMPPLISSSLDWDRKHGHHVTDFCDWVCLPNDLAADFARKQTGTPFEKAFLAVVLWAHEVRAAWAGRIVPDGSMWDFWKHRWTETHGGSKPQTGVAFDPLAGFKALRKDGSHG